MLLSFKRWLVVLSVAVLTQSAFGFAMLGPRDTWQVNTLGYDPQGDFGDLGGPKNLGEEWRWNIPEITYGFDNSFITFFGTNGINAVDEAMAAFNREMTNFAGLTMNALRQKPKGTRRVHETARALGVLDLKTAAMGLIAEQLGLASAERWTWAIRARATPGPNVTNYSVIRRNFDPFTYKPTHYVNGTAYSYQIKQYPAANFATDFEAAAVFPVRLDEGEFTPSLSALVGEDLTTIPLISIHAGLYYAGLTQDDIGGLKYIYSRDNVNTEDVVPATTIAFVDRNTVVFQQGIDAFNFYSNAVFTNPSNLVAQFPSLIITSTNVSVTNVISTNVFITNFTSSGLFTNTAALTLITNLDLYAFSEASRTNDPVTLRAAYPQLLITSTNTIPTLQVSEVYFLTNQPWAPVGSPPTVATNLVTNIVANYRYTFSNVITNYAGTPTSVRIEDSIPLTTSIVTNRFSYTTNVPSGGFFLVDRTGNPNLVGFSFEDATGTPLLRVTNVVEVTNVLAAVPATGFLRQGINRFTNVVYAAYPVLLNSTLGGVVVTNLTTNLVTRYDYTFANLLLVPPANGNTSLILQTINGINPANPVITSETVPSPFPMGTVLVLDTNQFVLTGDRLETFGLTTNVITTFLDPGTGIFFTQQLIRQTNSILFAANPVVFQAAAGPLLRPGVNSIQFRQIRYQDFLSQSNAVSTNLYTSITITNGVRSTNIFRRVAGPDLLFRADDLGVSTGGIPIGYARGINFQAGATAVAAGGQFDGGPGLIVPGSNLSFSKLYPFNFNQNPNFMTEETADRFFSWGSFDGRTIVPRIYPEDLSTQLTLEQLEAYALGRNPPR